MKSALSGIRLPLCGLLLSFSAAVSAAPQNGRRPITWRDYEPERPDGRTEHTMTWAMMRLRKANPPGFPPYLTGKAEYEKWRSGRRARVLGMVGDRSATVFKLLSEERRDGYVLRRYEFYPADGLAVKTYMLVPDSAKPGATPGVVCAPGGGASIECLAGEPDHYFNRYPIRNRQAWWYVKAGMIAMAIENIGDANNAPDDINFGRTRSQSHTLLKFGGSSASKEMSIRVACCVEFLKRDPMVDIRKIAVSGLSRGASVTSAAMALPDVAALVYNDFVCDGTARMIAQTELMPGQSAGGGAQMEGLCACPPKHVLLVEGGAWKGAMEHVAKAFELAGVPERLTISYYRKYADPKSRKFDDRDPRTAKGLSMEGFFEWNNCDPYDHSFHPEVAVPWLCRLFFGRDDFTEKYKAELAEALAQREQKPEDIFPPGGPLKRKAMGGRPITEKDYVPERPDGRTEKTLTWAMMNLRRQKAPEGAASLKDAAAFRKWKAGHASYLKKSLQGLDLASPGDGGFRVLSESKRKGYTLYTCEFHPDEILAVKALVLVPDSARPRATPAVVCVPHSGCSMQRLADEPDPYGIKNDYWERQAWWYVKTGLVAVALELPGEMNGAPEGLSVRWSRWAYARLLRGTGWSDAGLVAAEVRMCIEYLKRHPMVDPKRIALSASREGCVAARAAVVLPDVAALVYCSMVGDGIARTISQTGDRSVTHGMSQPARDLSAFAPRPLLLTNGGLWKNALEDLAAGYRLSGAEGKFTVSYPPRYDTPEKRPHDAKVLRDQRGLTAGQYSVFCNGHPSRERFCPEVALPWIRRVFFGDDALPAGVAAELKAGPKARR